MLSLDERNSAADPFTGFSLTLFGAGAIKCNFPTPAKTFFSQRKTNPLRARRAVKMEQAMNATLFTESDLTTAMKAFYTAAVGVYTSGEQPLGCLIVSTAVCSAPTHPDVQTDLLNVLKVIDASFERRMEIAWSAGQLPKSFDCKNRARFGQALLHSLSVRARAGESQQELMGLIDTGVDLLLSPP
jgi:hypothetical protein